MKKSPSGCIGRSSSTIPGYLVKRNQLESNRLKPIFRDRDELSSSASLGKSIEAALRDSESLIVAGDPSNAFPQALASGEISIESRQMNSQRPATSVRLECGSIIDSARY